TERRFTLAFMPHPPPNPRLVSSNAELSGEHVRLIRAGGIRRRRSLSGSSPCTRSFSPPQLKLAGSRPSGMKVGHQLLGVILAVNDWATILPSRTTNVSVPNSYTLSAVSAVHRM